MWWGRARGSRVSGVGPVYAPSTVTRSSSARPARPTNARRRRMPGGCQPGFRVRSAHRAAAGRLGRRTDHRLARPCRVPLDCGARTPTRGDGRAQPPYNIGILDDACGALPRPVLNERFQPVFSGRSVTGNVCWQIASNDAASLKLDAQTLDLTNLAKPDQDNTWFALR